MAELSDAAGQPLAGHFSLGAPAVAHGVTPSLIIIHEIFGLNAQMRATADRFAAEGFHTFAIDLFGAEAATMAEGMAHAGKLTRETVLAQLRAAVDALRDLTPGTRLGVLGFCMGGGIALTAAAFLPDFDAAVTFYGPGQPAAGTERAAELGLIRCPVQGHFGKLDAHIPAAMVDEIEQALAASGALDAIYRYDAGHAFMNEDRPSYDAASAALAWQRTVAFLRAHLSAPRGNLR